MFPYIACHAPAYPNACWLTGGIKDEVANHTRHSNYSMTCLTNYCLTNPLLLYYCSKWMISSGNVYRTNLPFSLRSQRMNTRKELKIPNALEDCWAGWEFSDRGIFKALHQYCQAPDASLHHAQFGKTADQIRLTGPLLVLKCKASLTFQQPQPSLEWHSPRCAIPTPLWHTEMLQRILSNYAVLFS